MKGAEGTGLNQIIALRQQIVDRSSALQSLQAADKPAANPAQGQAATQAGAAQVTQANGSDFTDTLHSALNDVSATQKRSADLAAAYERGEVTDVAQVMLARQESSVAFEATLQVRNKLLSAYQDIMRMGA